MIDKIAPPLCGRVRLITAAVTLAVGIPRLWSFVPTAQLGLLPAIVYAWALIPVGVALVVTSYRWRLHWIGRLTAVLGFAAWMTLVFATISVTSIAINIIFAIVLFFEIIDRHDC